MPFSKVLYIDQGDISEQPPKGWKRLIPGGEVRLRHAYVMRCDSVVHDTDGKIVELQCSVDLATLGANPEGRKVKGVIQWVSAAHAIPAEVRLYDRLFSAENPEAEGQDFLQAINPDSLQIVQALLEPALADLEPEQSVQFEREGYFVADRYEWKGARRLMNRVLGLRDSWGKEKS